MSATSRSSPSRTTSSRRWARTSWPSRRGSRSQWTATPRPAAASRKTASRARAMGAASEARATAARRASPSHCYARSSTLLGELPGFVADERHRTPVGENCVDLEVRAADHEVDVYVRFVQTLARLTVDDEGQACAVGDVAGRVLVEKRVVEERSRLAHAGFVSNERGLTQPVGVLDRREMAADEVRAGLCLHADCAPVFEGQLEPADNLAKKQ